MTLPLCTVPVPFTLDAVSCSTIERRSLESMPVDTSISTVNREEKFYSPLLLEVVSCQVLDTGYVKLLYVTNWHEQRSVRSLLWASGVSCVLNLYVTIFNAACVGIRICRFEFWTPLMTEARLCKLGPAIVVLL